MKEKENNKECFVIMPISDPESYEKGHFKYVYEDLFQPAIVDEGYVPKRADDDGSSSMIQVNIVREIIEAPMAICDLSSRNPNVLFELGIRQAFDLPVVLVQEQGTQRIFDISTINTIDYRKDLIYREVIEDRRKITSAIKATQDNTKGINSIIRLLEIGKAELKDKGSEADDIRIMLFALSNQIDELKKERNVPQMREKNIDMCSFTRYLNDFQTFRNGLRSNISIEYRKTLLKSIRNELEEIMNNQLLDEKQRKSLEANYRILIDQIQNEIN